MVVQNIDPVYFLTPTIVVGFSVGLAVYWHYRRRFTAWVLLFSLVAYAAAILLKEVVQSLTLQPFEVAVAGDQAVLGLYYGLQTVVFEVGGAFLVAWYGVSRGKVDASDAEGYGIGLALWENGALIGAPLLINYVVYYVTLAQGQGAAAQQLSSLLANEAPSLFYPPSSALPLIGYAVMERVSSLLLHFSWGYLCVLAASFRRKVFLWCALPMGLVDFFVPFAGTIGVAAFEALILVIGLASVAVALFVSRGTYREQSKRFSSPQNET